MAVGKFEILFPVVVGDIVLASAEVVADMVANGMIGRRLPGDADALEAEQFVHGVGVMA